MTPGAHVEMTEAEYRAHPAINHSLLRSVERSVAHAKYDRDHPLAPSPEMIIGTCAHALVLRGQTPWVLVPENLREWAEHESKVEPNFPAIKPDGMSFATKEGKAWKALQEANGRRVVTPEEAWAEVRLGLEKMGLPVLSEEDDERVAGIGIAICTHPLASRIFTAGIPEVPVFAKHPYRTWADGSPVWCKALIDYLRPGNFIADLKTTKDASPDAFDRRAIQSSYLTQAAWYLQVCEWASNAPDACNRELIAGKSVFTFIAVETSPPHGVMIRPVTAHAIAWARDRVNAWLMAWIDAVVSNKWPVYPEQPVELGLPLWVARRDVRMAA